jgi:hypothetical protein
MRRLSEFVAVHVHNNQEDSKGHPEDLDLGQQELKPEESGLILSNHFFVDFQTQPTGQASGSSVPVNSRSWMLANKTCREKFPFEEPAEDKQAGERKD